jgi:hypothetical protein
MAKKRDHKRTYQERNRLARERGFKNYGEQRRASEYAKDGEMYEDATGGWIPRLETESRADYDTQLEMARLYYQAFKVDPNNYSKDGPKAKWFVGVQQIMTYEEWAQHYPRGVREYTRLHHAA